MWNVQIQLYRYNISDSKMKRYNVDDAAFSDTTKLVKTVFSAEKTIQLMHINSTEPAIH